MPFMCSNASWRTWTPLPDRFIDDHLVEMFPLFDQAWLQLVNVMNPAAIHTLLQLPQIWLAGKFCGEFFAPYPFSYLSTLIKTWSSAENTMFIDYAVYKWQVTAVSNAVLETEIFCHRYLNITPLSNNIFSWNSLVLLQIYSKTSAHNFIKIYLDLTFLSHLKVV